MQRVLQHCEGDLHKRRISPRGTSEKSSEAAGPSEELIRKRQQRLWYLAVKPPMYSVCIIPVLVNYYILIMDLHVLADEVMQTRKIPSEQDQYSVNFIHQLWL